MYTLSDLLSVLTSSSNAEARFRMSVVHQSLIGNLENSYVLAAKTAGYDRGVIESELTMLFTIRTLWTLVPERLFSELLPNYESMAEKALATSGVKDYSSVTVRDLSTIYRRLRNYSRSGRKTDQLNLERPSHGQLLKRQGNRCAICSYYFQLNDLDWSVEPEFPPRPCSENEVTLRHYHRRAVIDHILPHYLGGDGQSNLQILCVSCNAGKGDALCWMQRGGYLSTSRVSSHRRLTASTRYACLARHLSQTDVIPKTELRLFKVNSERTIYLENLVARE